MRNRTGILLVMSFASLGVLAIKAAPPQRTQQDQEGKDMNRGIPWAYGFATPFVAAPAPGAGGGAGGGGGRGGAGAAAPAPAAPPPAAEPEDRETPRHLAGAA